MLIQDHFKEDIIKNKEINKANINQYQGGWHTL